MATLTDRWDEGAAPRERFLGRLRDRLVAGDPAFSRLRLASRAILSLLLSLALLIGVHFLIHPLSLAAYGMAVVISFLGAMGVTDKGAAAQAATRSYGFVIAVILFFIAGLLAARPQFAFPVLLVVIFGAAYVRKFGQRWFGLGMVAFMSYFMGDYLRPAPGDIGWVAFAVALTFAVTQLVTTVILRDDPEQDFRRALKTIDRRINLILRALLDGLRPEAAGLDRKLLTRHLERLRDIVLMAEGFIPQGEAGSLAAAGAASDLAVALFELQLIVERLVGFVMANGSPPAALVQAVLYRDGAVVGDISARGAPDDEDDAASRLLMRVDWSRRRLEAVLGSQPSAAFRLKAGAAPGAPAQPATGAARRLGPITIPRDFELPIQMTLACGIALSCGLLLSSVRWYWAVFAAFLVFSNAKSRADTALRALHRSAGAFAGLIGGTALATLLEGQPIVSGVLIPVLFFIAFYFVQTSYGTMMFLVTVGLALLYGIMGMFSPELLVLRLAETVIGGRRHAGRLPRLSRARLADGGGRPRQISAGAGRPRFSGATPGAWRARAAAPSRPLPAARPQLYRSRQCRSAARRAMAGRHAIRRGAGKAAPAHRMRALGPGAGARPQAGFGPYAREHCPDRHAGRRGPPAHRGGGGRAGGLFRAARSRDGVRGSPPALAGRQ